MRDSQLLLRTITGLSIGGLIMLITIRSTPFTLLLILVIAFGCMAEFFRMQQIPGNARRVGLIILACLPVVAVGLQVSPSFSLAYHPAVLPALFGGVMMLVFVLHLRESLERVTHTLETFSKALVLFSVPAVCAVFLALQDTLLVLGAFVLLWSGDVFAYFGGRLFGKHKLSPAISPNKTWEGFFTGLCATALAAWILSLMMTDHTLKDWIITGVLVVVFGTAGDLLESAIKRISGVKDSGNILPGHGGIWDRFDSFLGCVPWIALYYFIA